MDVVASAVRRAKAKGTKVSIDPNVRADGLEPAVVERLVESILLADVVLPSEGELAAIGLDATELASSGTIVFETRDARGCVVHDINGSTLIDAIAVHAVDSEEAVLRLPPNSSWRNSNGADPHPGAGEAVRVAAAAASAAAAMTITFDGDDR